MPPLPLPQGGPALPTPRRTSPRARRCAGVPTNLFKVHRGACIFLLDNTLFLLLLNYLENYLEATEYSVRPVNHEPPPRPGGTGVQFALRVE